jgi:protein-disulfide isomerase
METRVKILRVVFGLLLVAWLAPRGKSQSSNEAEALSKPTKVPDGNSVDDLFLSLDGAPAMGDVKAPLAIVEFGDYQCPYCGLHASETLPQIVTGYVKAGKVRYFFKDFPVESLHPQAFKAAEAARCAGEQGKYWGMHDRLLKDQQTLSVEQLPAYALALDLDIPQFQQCLDNGTYDAQIRKDVQEGREKHVPGTPDFFLGTLDGQGARMKVVTVLHGYLAYSVFQKALDQILSSQEETSNAILSGQ